MNGEQPTDLVVTDQTPRITPTTLRDTTEQISLLQNMVASILKPNVHYGQTPGTQGLSLWDPGASLIISAFNCYSGHRRVLSFTDNEDRIAIVLEVPLISRTTGKELGTGIGAASTKETKYKYRYFTADEVRQMGYDDEDMAGMKKKDNKFRVENPEYGELLNTLTQMASKRAEVDAAKALPGVSTVLKSLFLSSVTRAQTPERPGPAVPPAAQQGPKTLTWTEFWSKARQMGLEAAQVHEILNTESVKTWLDQNRKTLDDALTYLAHQL